MRSYPHSKSHRDAAVMINASPSHSHTTWLFGFENNFPLVFRGKTLAASAVLVLWTKPPLVISTIDQCSMRMRERERERDIWLRDDLNAFFSSSDRGAFIMITILPFVGQHPISVFFSYYRRRRSWSLSLCCCCISWKATALTHTQTHTHTHSLLEIMQECSLPVLHLFIFLHPPSVCSALPSSSSSDSFTSDSLASSSSSSSRCEHDALRFSPFSPSLLLLLLPLQYLVSPHSNLVFFLWKATTTVRTKRMVKCL